MTYEKWKGDMSNHAPFDGSTDTIIFVVMLAWMMLVSVLLVVVLIQIG